MFIKALNAVRLQDRSIIERFISFVASREIRIIDAQVGVALLEAQEIGAIPSTVIGQL